MAKELDSSYLQKEQYDIFLCTRGLPDALTGETAAVRQLMSALIGSGYRVFFPSALPGETPPEALAAAMAEAVKTAPVMIAAAVGPEGAGDETARFLWKRFREMTRDDPGRRFIACVRDLDALPEELQGAEILDMGALDFLAVLKARLGEALPERNAEPEPEEAPEEESPVPEELTEPEAAPGEEASSEPEEAPEPRKDRRRLFLALAAACALLSLLCLVLFFLLR